MTSTGGTGVSLGTGNSHWRIKLKIFMIGMELYEPNMVDKCHCPCHRQKCKMRNASLAKRKGHDQSLAHTVNPSQASHVSFLSLFHCLILNGDENGHPSLLDPSQAVEVVIMEFTFQIIVQWSVSNTSGAAEHHGADHR